PELHPLSLHDALPICELINERHSPLDPGAVGAISEVPKVGLVTFSKPIWFYGLEALAEKILPAKDGRQRRLAFAQLALPGAYPEDRKSTRLNSSHVKI